MIVFIKADNRDRDTVTHRLEEMRTTKAGDPLPANVLAKFRQPKGNPGIEVELMEDHRCREMPSVSEALSWALTELGISRDDVSMPKQTLVAV